MEIMIPEVAYFVTTSALLSLVFFYFLKRHKRQRLKKMWDNEEDLSDMIFGSRKPEFGKRQAPETAPAFPAGRHDRDTPRMSVHSGISKSREAGLPLSKTEKVVFFADGFDSYLSNSGFDGFIDQAQSEENLGEYISALTALGLSEIVSLVEDGAQRYSDVMLAFENATADKVQNMSAPLLAISREITEKIQALDVNIEEVIEQYIDLRYPWRQS